MNALPTTSIQIDMDVYKAIEARRESFGDSHNDILRKALLSSARDGSSPLSLSEARGAASNRQVRSTGVYGFVLKGKRFAFSSLKLAYKNMLLELATADDTFLDRLSKEETSARRLIAKDPKALYKKTPHLADEFAEELIDGWWMDTNLSQQQIESRSQIACKVASLDFGSDLQLEFPKA